MKADLPEEITITLLKVECEFILDELLRLSKDRNNDRFFHLLTVRICEARSGVTRKPELSAEIQERMEKIIQSVDIALIINRQVPLTDNGHNLLGRCPFHEDKARSFTISKKMRFYHCFGCNASGSVIDFVMKRYNKELPEAMDMLENLDKFFGEGK